MEFLEGKPPPMRLLTLATAATVSVMSALPVSAQEKSDRTTAPPVTFAGGASSVSEEHQDWSVTCTVLKGNKECYVSQVLGRRQAGERVLTVELRAPKDNRLSGLIFAPLGIKLAAGGSLRIDDAELLSRAPFSMCVEQGCVLPVEFDAQSVTKLQQGKTLRFAAVNASNGEAVNIDISLAGLTSALNRSAELVK